MTFGSLFTGGGSLRRLAQPVFLILLLAFGARLININAPVTGVASWRQADTAAMARNFQENRFNPLYPQIDWGGSSSGYVESEFPAYTFTVASVYKIFGTNEALARLLSALLSVASIYFVYLLARELLGKTAATWSALFFAFLPMQIFYGRTIMPESLLMLGISGGVYFFYRWYRRGDLADIVLSGAFIAIACLIKPPTLYLFLPLAYLAWLRYRTRALSQPQLWLFTAIVLVPLALWYYHAHQLYLETGLTFGIWTYGSDKWGNWNLLGSLDFWKTVLWDHLARQLAFLGFVLLEIGLVVKRRDREEYMLDIWLVALVIYVLLVAKGNFAHEYYLVPAMVPMALVIGKGFGRIVPRLDRKDLGIQQLGMLSLAVLVLAGSAAIYVSYLRQEAGSPRLELAQAIQSESRPADLVVTVDSSDPTLLYLSHRKGWAISSSQMQDKFPGAVFIAGFNYEQSFLYRITGG